MSSIDEKYGVALSAWQVRTVAGDKWAIQSVCVDAVSDAVHQIQVSICLPDSGGNVLGAYKP